MQRTRNTEQKDGFQEPAESAYLLSQFEAQQISKVCRTLVKVLEAFDESLEKENGIGVRVWILIF